MKVIGLTGGVGSGKSLAAQMLAQECDAILLITDELGHKVMEPGQEGYLQVVEYFGKDILTTSGTIHRERLAERVFHREEDRQVLNDIIHPQVIRYVREFIDAKREESGVIVLESALLFESGCDAFCDTVWYVRVSQENRIRRLQESRHYSREKIAGIMAKQLPEKEFLAKSDVVLENDNTPGQLRETICKQLQESGI